MGIRESESMEERKGKKGREEEGRGGDQRRDGDEWNGIRS